MTITKKDLLRKLEASPVYQKALKMVPKDQQDRIRELMDRYMEDATKQLLPFLERLEGDPELQRRLREELRGDGSDSGVVSTEED